MSGFSVPQYTAFYQAANAAGGSINVYQTGTTTFVTCYSDGVLTTPITNPIVLDSNGQAKFYVSGSVNLRIDSYTASGIFIESIDPIYPVSGVSTSSAGSVVYQATNLTLSTTNLQNNIVATAAINIALPLSTGFINSFSVQLNAQGGAITLTCTSPDKINIGSVTGTAGASVVLAAGQSASLWTDAVGNWGLNFPTLKMAVQQLTASGTYTPSSGMQYCIVELLGGGGGGGGFLGSGSNSGASGGGGASSYSKALFTASQIGASKAVVIGTAGTAGASGNNAGGNGGISTFGSTLLTANGGIGASGATVSTGYQISFGGAGGSVGSTTGTSIIINAGATGQAGSSSGTVISGYGGAGANSFYGAGGSSAIGATGTNATGYGAGGSGTGNTTTSYAGGAGTAGICIITEFCL